MSAASPHYFMSNMRLDEIKACLRKLSMSVSNGNKATLCHKLAERLRDDYSHTARVIEETWYEKRGNPAGTNRAAAAQPQRASSSTVATAPLTAASSSHSSGTDFATKLVNEEVLFNQGLVNKVTLLGATWITAHLPQKNTFQTVPLDANQVALLARHSVKVICRFIVYHPSEQTIKFPDVWPSSCELMVHDQILFNTIHRNNLGMTPLNTKNPPPVLDLTNIIMAQNGRGVKVNFGVQLVASNSKWLVAVMLTARKDQESILDEVRKRSPTKQQCVERVKLSFRGQMIDVDVHEEDDEAPLKTEINLRDPTSFGDIRHATRTRTCTHLQCFDLFTYLTMQQNSRSPKWLCPLCSADAKFNQLIFDYWFQDILDSNQQGYQKADIYKDAIYILTNLPSESDLSSSEDEDDNRKRSKLSSTVPPPQAPSKPPPPPTTTAVSHRRISTSEVIELLDDDDDLF